MKKASGDSEFREILFYLNELIYTSDDIEDDRYNEKEDYLIKLENSIFNFEEVCDHKKFPKTISILEKFLDKIANRHRANVIFKEEDVDILEEVYRRENF